MQPLGAWCEQRAAADPLARRPEQRPAPLAWRLQEWEDFGEYAADIVRQVEAGRMGEAEADERMRPAVLYQVGPAASPRSPSGVSLPLCEHAWGLLGAWGPRGAGIAGLGPPGSAAPHAQLPPSAGGHALAIPA